MASTDGFTDPASGLHRRTLGQPTDRTPRLVLAHGFTQNGECWGRFAELLAANYEVVAVDSPGHGRSNHDNADLWRSAELLVDAGGSAIYLGYSMGGRTALHAALATPDLVQSLVLIGATAGLDDEDERVERRLADARLADRLMTTGLEAFLQRWLASPLFAGLDREQAAVDARLTNRCDGLAASLRRCGTGTQEPLWSRLGELTMPVLIIVGEQDEKFRAIGQRMVEAMTGTEAQLLAIPGTHAVHLERPDDTAGAVLAAIAGWKRSTR